MNINRLLLFARSMIIDCFFTWKLLILTLPQAFLFHALNKSMLSKWGVHLGVVLVSSLPWEMLWRSPVFSDTNSDLCRKDTPCYEHLIESTSFLAGSYGKKDAHLWKFFFFAKTDPHQTDNGLDAYRNITILYTCYIPVNIYFPQLIE